MPVDEVVQRFERTRKLDGATDEGFLLFVFLDAIVDRFFDVSDAVEDRLEAIEDDIFFDPDAPAVSAQAPADRSVTERLYRLRHDLIGFRRVVSPLRDAVNPLLRNEVGFLGDAAVLHLRDVYDHVVRAIEMAEAQRDLLNGALEAHLSLVSNRMNLVMKRATSWGAILVCATLVAGIYGMNFKHMPELDWMLRLSDGPRPHGADLDGALRHLQAGRTGCSRDELTTPPSPRRRPAGSHRVRPGGRGPRRARWR